MRVAGCRLLGICAGLALALPAGLVSASAAAGAETVIGSTPAAGPGGLPDDRVYEEATPADKNGNFVVSGGGQTTLEGEGYGAASADGNAVVFMASGAMGGAVSSMLGPYVAHRSATGWSTQSAIPAQIGATNLSGGALMLDPSRDFSGFLFGSSNAETRYSPEEPAGPFHSLDLYASTDPFAVSEWLGKPTIADPLPAPGRDFTNELGLDFDVAGASPALDTVYFGYSGTLIAQDAARAANIGEGLGQRRSYPWGFYEWHEGVLTSAGVLPDGSLSPFGAIPANIAGDGHSGDWQATTFDNEVSLDGSRAFFVSPDPAASLRAECPVEDNCTSEAPELYVRETAQNGEKRSVLVSRSELTGQVGDPAPDGPVGVVDAPIHGGPFNTTYVYASPDGSQAFFASADRLTEAAPEGTAIKEYDFDLDSGTLTYLPGVVGPIVAAAVNGSDFIFKNTAASPAQLDLWSAGPAGGSVSEVAQLPAPPEIGQPYNGQVSIEARASADGSAFVFDTNAPIPGGFNNQAGFGEVYRYDTVSSTLTCISCPPPGVTPTGSATISYDNVGGTNDRPRSTVDTRVISADGSRVFFDTPDALVPQDTNGQRDVYEWENATLYLISSGTGQAGSYYLDSSESGDDVFFDTAVGLATGDADGAYDVYDARIPRPGDTSTPSAVPCQGDVCQGPPSVPQLLGAPASATFAGLGNAVGAAAPTVKAGKPRAKRKAAKRKVAHKKRSARNPHATSTRKGKQRGKPKRKPVGRPDGGRS